MADNRLSPVEMVHQAMQERGEVEDAVLSAFIQERFGIRIEPRFIPVLKASVREREVVERARQAARELAERLRAEQEAKPAKKPRGKRAKQPAPEGETPGETPARTSENPAEIRSFADGVDGPESA